MLRKLLFMFILFFCLSQTSMAVTDGSGWKIWAEVVKLYQQMKKAVNELKTSSETLSKMKEMYKEAYATYRTVKYFNIDNVVRDFERDIEAITSLDNLDGKTLDQKLRIIDQEMDRRITDARLSGDEDRIAHLNDQKATLERIKLLNDLEKASLENAKTSATDIGQKDASQINAQSTSILAALATAEEKRRLREEMAAKDSVNSQRKFDKESRTIYDALGKIVW